MGFVDLDRIISSSDTQVDASSREAAVMKAINKETGTGTTQDAVELGNLPGGIWPILDIYENDLAALNSLNLPPAFIWDDADASPGETRYFATARLIGTNQELLIFVLTFSDDAHKLFVEERSPEGVLISSLTPMEGLTDGSLDPNAGATSAPFQWQQIRYWSTDDFFPASAENYLVISYEAVNYNPIGPVNPAGLAFVADIYDASDDPSTPA